MPKAKRPHYSGTDHRVPEQGSAGYIRIVKRGCASSDSFEGGAFTCDHGYTWACEDCPVNDATHQGPEPNGWQKFLAVRAEIEGRE